MEWQPFLQTSTLMNICLDKHALDWLLLSITSVQFIVTTDDLLAVLYVLLMTKNHLEVSPRNDQWKDLCICAWGHVWQGCLSSCHSIIVGEPPSKLRRCLICLSDIFWFIHEGEVFAVMDECALDPGAESNKISPLVDVLCTCLFLPSLMGALTEIPLPLYLPICYGGTLGSLCQKSGSAFLSFTFSDTGCMTLAWCVCGFCTMPPETPFWTTGKMVTLWGHLVWCFFAPSPILICLSICPYTGCKPEHIKRAWHRAFGSRGIIPLFQSSRSIPFHSFCCVWPWLFPRQLVRFIMAIFVSGLQSYSWQDG